MALTLTFLVVQLTETSHFFTFSMTSTYPHDPLFEIYAIVYVPRNNSRAPLYITDTVARVRATWPAGEASKAPIRAALGVQSVPHALPRPPVWGRPWRSHQPQQPHWHMHGVLLGWRGCARNGVARAHARTRARTYGREDGGRTRWHRVPVAPTSVAGRDVARRAASSPATSPPIVPPLFEPPCLSPPIVLPPVSRRHPSRLHPSVCSRAAPSVVSHRASTPARGW